MNQWFEWEKMKKKNTKCITFKYNAISAALVTTPYISIYFYNKNEENSNSSFSNEKNTTTNDSFVDYGENFKGLAEIVEFS